MNLSEILNFNILPIGDHSVAVYQLLVLLLILILAKYGTNILIKTLDKLIKADSLDTGRRYAFEKFLRYFIYTIAFMLASQSIGLDMSFLLAGSAALMVGIGFGLQQTANDFISGIIILLDGSVNKDNVLTIGDDLGTIKDIGLRTSKMKTLDNRYIIIPNSKLVNDNVTNWSHNDEFIRFCVNVGVAYGSNTKLVQEILLKVAKNESGVLDTPAPFARFENFGDSSLDFELYFFHKNIINFMGINSSIRLGIDAAFRENGIEIPFPQRDLWIKNPVVAKTTAFVAQETSS